MKIWIIRLLFPRCHRRRSFFYRWQTLKQPINLMILRLDMRVVSLGCPTSPHHHHHRRASSDDRILCAIRWMETSTVLKWIFLPNISLKLAFFSPTLVVCRSNSLSLSVFFFIIENPRSAVSSSSSIVRGSFNSIDAAAVVESENIFQHFIRELVRESGSGGEAQTDRWYRFVVEHSATMFESQSKGPPPCSRHSIEGWNVFNCSLNWHEAAAMAAEKELLKIISHSFSHLS